MYLYCLPVIFHALACLHRLIACSAISSHQHDVESAMLEHSLITTLTGGDAQGSSCFIPHKLDFREFTLFVVIVVALILIERKRSIGTRIDTDFKLIPRLLRTVLYIRTEWQDGTCLDEYRHDVDRTKALDILLGIVNTAFFDGDILFSYSIYGLVLIPLSYLPTKWLWWVVAFLFIQPIEIYSLITGWQVDASSLSEVYGNMYNGHQHGTFLENAYSNLRYGQVATYYWCMMKGRHTQTICLFILGMLVGRKRWFYNENNNLALWKKVLVVSILVLIVGGIADVRHMETWNNWLYPIYNFFILSFVVSGFVLLWYGKEWFRKGLSFLRQFGKMSLTNYFLQSIIGCGLFAYYGFNLQTKLGITYAFFVGIAMVVVQCLFSNLWLKYHSHGPFEEIWKKLTWIKF